MIPRSVARALLIAGAVAVLVGAASGLGGLIGVVPIRGSVPTAAVAAVASLVLLVATQRLLGSAPERPPLSKRTPEQVEPVPVLGASLDDAIDRGDDRFVRTRLSTLAADRLETRTGADAEEATAALVRGAWTDDTLAAAAIPESSTTPPLSHRLYGRLFPRRGLERQTKRTLAAIEAIDAGTLERHSEGQQPERSPEIDTAAAADPASADRKPTEDPSPGVPSPGSDDQTGAAADTEGSTATSTATASTPDGGVQPENRPSTSQEGAGK